MNYLIGLNYCLGATMACRKSAVLALLKAYLSSDILLYTRTLRAIFIFFTLCQFVQVRPLGGEMIRLDIRCVTVWLIRLACLSVSFELA